MKIDEKLAKIWGLDREIASLRYKYFEKYGQNKYLAMKLFGYRALFPDKFDENIVKRMDSYVRKNE